MPNQSQNLLSTTKTIPPEHLSQKVIDRFWSHVNKTDNCWEWSAAPSGGGYGDFSLNSNGRSTHFKAHRFSWIITNGPIPDRLCVCHHCDNRKCVRPDHLFLGTYKDNARDCMKKGRHPCQSPINHLRNYYKQDNSRRLIGSRHPRAKLSEEKVTYLRREHSNGRTMESLAKEFGVSSTTISKVVKGKMWKHIIQTLATKEDK